MFYINYEECKWVFPANLGECKKCFILTMRNVNARARIKNKQAQAGFILTMRNVNKFSDYIKPFVSNVLY